MQKVLFHIINVLGCNDVRPVFISVCGIGSASRSKSCSWALHPKNVVSEHFLILRAELRRLLGENHLPYSNKMHANYVV